MTETRLDFAWNVHQYLREFIQFADTKAGFVFAWCNGVLVLLAGSNVVSPLFSLAKWSQQPMTQLLAVIAIFLLVVGAVLAILAIYPFLKKFIPSGEPKSDVKHGVIFWGEIRAQSEKEYVSQVANGEELTESVARHCYTLAGIAARKYWMLKYAIGFAFAGSGFGTIVFVIGG